jgi:hypothetical protein
MPRIPQAVQQLLPVGHIERPGVQAEPLDDQLVQPVFHEAGRHFVNGKLFVAFFDHRLARHIAEERDLLPILEADRPFGAANEHVGLDADFAELADRMLRRLGLQFAGRFRIGHQRQVDIKAIVLADVERKTGGSLRGMAGFRCRRRCRRFP